MSDPTIEDVLQILDSHFGKEYGDVVRHLKDFPPTSNVKDAPYWLVTVSGSMGKYSRDVPNWAYGSSAGPARSHVYQHRGFANKAYDACKAAGYQVVMHPLVIAW